MQMDFNKLNNAPGSASRNFRKVEESVKEENKKNCLKGSSTKISLKTKSKFTAAAKLKKARTKKLNHSKVAVISDTSDRWVYLATFSGKWSFAVLLLK